MPRDQDRRQKALERKATKRKEHLRTMVRSEGSVAPASVRALVRAAAQWPLYETWMTRDWKNEENLVQAVVARRSPTGQLAAAVFLIDLGCLGVKNALVRPFASRAEYDALLETLGEEMPLEKADLDLVAKVIDEGITYAKQLGFRPHRDYYEAAAFLAGAEPEACHVKIPLGREGKPFFFAGPYDNVKRIMAQLTRRLGPNGFHYVVPVGPEFQVIPAESDSEEAGDED
ncbi:MAG TPA: hypothetical protein VNL16_16055 [Chloroflexota bacterium]|nr:hypothetical protein [Chloroflexota bacterium]